MDELRPDPVEGETAPEPDLTIDPVVVDRLAAYGHASEEIALTADPVLEPEPEPVTPLVVADASPGPRRFGRRRPGASKQRAPNERREKR